MSNTSEVAERSVELQPHRERRKHIQSQVARTPWQLRKGELEVPPPAFTLKRRCDLKGTRRKSSARNVRNMWHRGRQKLCDYWYIEVVCIIVLGHRIKERSVSSQGQDY